MAQFKQVEVRVHSGTGEVNLLIHFVGEPGISFSFTPKSFRTFHSVIREASLDLDATERVREMKGKI
jgi:hypothetical protein